MRVINLFSNIKLLREYLDEIDNRLTSEIYSIEENEFMNLNLEDVIPELIEKYTQDMIVLDYAKKHVTEKVESRTSEFDVIVYHIPFLGNSDFLRYGTHSHYGRWPKGSIINSELQIEISFHKSQRKPDYINQRFNEERELIDKYLTMVDEEVAKFNENLPMYVNKKIKKRQQEIQKKESFFKELGVPVLKQSSNSQTYSIPLKKKTLSFYQKTPTMKQTKREPSLTSDDYNDIIGAINKMGESMETDPQAYQSLNEEKLRSHIVSMLNGRFQAFTSAETFSVKGKTDILLTIEGKNVFVAECAIWHGVKYLIEKIDQLLSYKNWRNSKTAIIKFCRNKEFSNILKQVDTAVDKHSNFVRKETSYQKETSFQYIFHHSNDKRREFILTILFYDLYV